MGDQKQSNQSYEGSSTESLPDLASRFPKESGDLSKDLASKSDAERATEQSSAEKDDVYQKILSSVKVKNNSSGSTVVANDASVLDQQMDRESQVKLLVDIAMSTSIEHAVAVARHAEDYYVLDQLHDRLLAEDLHEALMQKGLIEEI